MNLFYREFGDGDKNLIIIHGLYGSSDNWVTIAKLLMDHFHVYLVDQRNHGQSPHNSQMDYASMAQDINEFMDHHNLKPASVMGHSMGGKTAMTFALLHPERVDKLLILDIAPKSYGSFSNYAKITNDHRNIVDALLSIHPEEYNSRSEIDKALKEDIPNNMVRSFLLKNIARNEDKSLYWKLNITSISENLDQIMDGFSDPIPDTHYPENKEVFLIRGGDSPYVQEEDMQHVRSYFPSAQFTSIPNAGHWLHAEQPEYFIKTVKYFLDE